jgi:hypothetical protein
MQNLNLTEWLDMVWNALQEADESKRSDLLEAAHVFLQDGAEAHEGELSHASAGAGKKAA